MANEPERPIEKLLRAAAKKRRDQAGAPLDLHPATRRLLQGEVARTFAKPKRERRSFSEALGQMWLRLALGVAIFAVLAKAVYILLPVPGKGKPEALLAENEPAPQAVPAKQPLTPPPSATAPASPAPAVQANSSAVALAETAPPARQLEAERQPLSKDTIAPQTEHEAREKPVLPAAPQSADRQPADEPQIAAVSGATAQPPAGTANDALNRQLGLAAQPAPPASMTSPALSPAPVITMSAAAPVAAANEPAKLTGENAGQPAFDYVSPGRASLADWGKPSAAKGVAITQRFAQVALGAKTKAALADKAASAHPVLVSFQVEQAGRELRIVDGDGSVYSGYVQIADAAHLRRSAKAEAAPAVVQAARSLEWPLEEKAAARLDSDHPAPQTYFFRVAGTNRSLNKKVVFTGDLIAATNSPSFQPVTNHLSFESALAGGRAGSAPPDLLPLLNARISGKVVVGNGKAVEINALPASP